MQKILMYFNNLDTDNSGYLNFPQFRRFVKALDPNMLDDDISKAFRAADTNSNKMISVEEFVAWTHQVKLANVQKASNTIGTEDAIAKNESAEDYVGLALGALYAGQVAMWDLNTGKHLKTLGVLPDMQRHRLEHDSTEAERDKASHLGKINCIDVDWKGKRFLTGSADHTLKLWSLGGAVEKTYSGCLSEVLCIAADWDNGIFVSGGLASQIKIWYLDRPRPVETFENDRAKGWGMLGGTNCVAVGWQQNLLICGADNWLQVWDLNSKTTIQNGAIIKPKCLGKLEGHEGPVTGVLADFSKMRAVSASSDKTLRVWDLLAGTALQILTGHEGEICCIAGDLAQNVVVTGGGTGAIKFWDIEAGECCLSFEKAKTNATEFPTELGFPGHSGAVMSIALGPCNRFLVTSSVDGTVKMWDSKTQACIQTIQADEDRWGGVWVTSIAVQPKAQDDSAVERFAV